jgi:hypothetical protein
MGPLRTGQGRRRERWVGRETLLHSHFHLLVPKQLHAHPSMGPTAPIMRSRTGAEPITNGCEPHAHAGSGFAVALPCALSTVRAVGRDDNCGDFLHTRCAGFHRLLCVVHAGSAAGKPGNAASHLPGAQSPGPRSDQTPYRILCNDVKREGVKVSSDLASGFFCYIPLHKIRYGIRCPHV